LSGLIWSVRALPLAPQGVWARGRAASRLGRRLLERAPEALGALSGLGGEGALVVLGAPEALPWVDGVGYLAPEPEAPGLWLPTTHAVSPHPALVTRALPASLRSPVALLPDGVALALGDARPLSWMRLSAWLRAQEAGGG
jgi:hypothetical protein